MADNYEVVGSFIVSEKKGPDEVEDRERVYVRALPSRIVFPLDFAVGVDISPAFISDVPTIAAHMNEAFSTPGVFDIVINDDTDAAGFIYLTGTTTVTSSNGRLSNQFTDAYSTLNSDAWKARVAAMRADLNKLAGA